MSQLVYQHKNMKNVRNKLHFIVVIVAAIFKWLREAGVIPAKDQMSVKDFWRIENQSEEKLDKVREPAQKFAQALLR